MRRDVAWLVFTLLFGACAPASRHPPPASSKVEFPTQRPEKRIQPIPGQTTAVEAFAVPLDLSHGESIPVGIGITGYGMGAQFFVEPIRSILLKVEYLVGYSFDWEFAPMLPDGGMSFPGGVIVINPQRLSMVPPDAAFFGLLHEAGHQVLGHTSQAAIVEGMVQPWLRPEMELQADQFAACKMFGAGVNPHSILVDAASLFGASPGDATHPPGMVRVHAVQLALSSGCAGAAP